MTDDVTIEADAEEGDAWLEAYPAGHRAMLQKFGVPTWMNERADAHNRRLITLIEAGRLDEAEFAALAEQSFNEHFGEMLAAWANEATSAAGQGDAAVRHVDLDARHQVSIANGIGHVMTRFRKREIAAMAGFTIDARGAMRMFGGGKTERKNLLRAVEYLQSTGIHTLSGNTQPTAADASGAATAEPGTVHTRDRREQQAAVARAVRDVRRRHRESAIEIVVGVTVDHLGRIHPFGGGETDGRLLEAAIDAMREFIGQAEKRYDH